MSAGKFLAGFIVGGVVGSVIGVLLAPQSGEETREILAENSKELYGNTEASIKEFQEKADTVMSDIQKKGDELLGKVQELINKQSKELSQ